MKPEPELIAKISTALIAGALGAQQVMPAQPISLPEIGLAALGGLAGGVALIRTADPSKKMTGWDRAYTVLFSGTIGAMLGPGIANWAAHVWPFVSEGLFENLFAGLAAGAAVPVLFGVVVAVLRYGEKHPQAVIDVLSAAGARISKAAKALKGKE